MILSQVIIKPAITEKSTRALKENKYSFLVDRRANKKLVREAVEKLFKVKVLDIWISKTLGKVKKVGRLKTKTKESTYKKAIVKLAKDQKIDLFDSGEKK